MINSGDVASIITSQNQAFWQSGLFQQVGIASPSTGIGAYGAAPPQSPAFFAPPGMARPPTPINFAPSGMFAPGYGSGNRFAGGVVSGLGAAATLGAGMMFSPLGAAYGGFMSGIGGGLAAGIGGAIGAAAVPAAGLAIAGTGIRAFMGGALNQQAVQTQLNQFQFLNPNARSGQGFTRDDASAIGNSIRTLAHIPEMMTSVEELTRMLPRLKSMGVMQGVKDAQEFSRRFKDTIETIQGMAKFLGTTLEDASKFFETSRSMGMIGRKDQIKNMLNVQYTSAMTGLSIGDTLSLQQSGAEMSAQFGGRRSSGAAGIMRLTQRLQYAKEQGDLPEGIIEEITGQTGDEGMKTMAARAYQAMLGLGNTGIGRTILAGAFKQDESGRFVLDRGMIDRLNQTGDISPLKERAAALTERQKKQFHLQAQDLAAQAAGSLNIGAVIRGLTAGRDPEDAKIILQQNLGLTEQEAELMGRIGGGPSENDQQRMALRRARDQEIQNRTDPTRIMHRIKERIKGKTGYYAAEGFGKSVFERLGREYDEFMTDLVGDYVVSLSQQGFERFSNALRGGNIMTDDMRKMFAVSGGAPTEFGYSGKYMNILRNAPEESTFMSLMRGLTGEQTAQQKQLALYAGYGVGPGQSTAEAAQVQKRLRDLQATNANNPLTVQLNRVFAGMGSEAAAEDKMKAAEQHIREQFRSSLPKQSVDVGGKMFTRSVELEDVFSGIYSDSGNTGWKAVNEYLQRKKGNSDPRLQAIVNAGVRAQNVAPNVNPINQIIEATVGGAGVGQVDLFANSNFNLADFVNTKNVAIDLREAENKLRSKMPNYGLVQGNQQAQGLLYQFLQSGSKVSRIMSGSRGPAEAQKRLMEENLGFYDLKTIEAAYAGRKGIAPEDTPEVAQALAGYSANRFKADAMLVQSAILRAAETPGLDLGLQKALREEGRDFKPVIKDKDGNVVANPAFMKNVREQVAKFTERLRGSSGEERERELSKAGPLEGAVRQALGVSRESLRGMSLEDVRRRYGLTDQTMYAEDFAGKRSVSDLTSAQFSKLQDAIAGQVGAASLIQKTEQEIAGEKDTEMVKFLKLMNDFLPRVNSRLDMLLDKKTKD